MIGDDIRNENDGEQDARENASPAEIIPDESLWFLDERDGEDGEAEEQESLDADKGKEQGWKESSEVIRQGHLLKKLYELESEEKEEKEREIFGEREVKEKEGNEATGKKNESMPGHFRRKLFQEKVESER